MDIYVAPNPATGTAPDQATAGRSGTSASPYTSIAQALNDAKNNNGPHNIYLLGGGTHYHGTLGEWVSLNNQIVTVQPAPGLSSATVGQWSYSGGANPIGGSFKHFRFQNLNFTGGWKVCIRSSSQTQSSTTTDTWFVNCQFGGGVQCHRFDGLEFHNCSWDSVTADCILCKENSPTVEPLGYLKNFKALNCTWVNCGPTSGTAGKDHMQFNKCSGTWLIKNCTAIGGDPFDIPHTDLMEVLLPIKSDCDFRVENFQARGGIARMFFIPQDDFAGQEPAAGMGNITVVNCDLRHERNSPPSGESVLKIVDTTGDIVVVSNTLRCKNGALSPSTPALYVGYAHAGMQPNSIQVRNNIIDGNYQVASPGNTFVNSGFNLVPVGGYYDQATAHANDVSGRPTYQTISSPGTTNAELAPGSLGVSQGAVAGSLNVPLLDRFTRNRNGQTDIGCYELGGVVQGGSDTTPPSVPTGVDAVASGAVVTITWNASTDDVGVSHYQLFRDDTMVPGRETVLGTVTTDSPGVGTFAYKVRAVDTSGNFSALSTSDSATVSAGDTTAPTPNPPTGLAVQVNAALAHLSWNAFSDAGSGVGGTEVYRSTSAGGTYVQIATVGGTHNRYTDEPGSAGTFYYKIRAFDLVTPTPNFTSLSSSANGTVTAPTASRFRASALSSTPAYYARLDEAASASNAIDQINPAVAGTYTNLAAGAYGAAALLMNESDTSIDFDGSNDFINVAHHAKLSATSELTLAAWVNPDVVSGGGGSNPVTYVRGYTTSNSGGATSIAKTGVDATATDSYLVVAVAFRGSTEPGGSVTGVTHGASALTFIGEAHRTDGTDVRRVELWGKQGLTGSQTVTATLAGGETYNSQALSCRVYSNVHQTTPTGSFNGAGSSSAGPVTVNVTSAVGELVVDAAVCTGVRSMTVGAGQTERQNFASGTASSDVDLATSDEPGAASVTMSWTLSASTQWGVGGVSLKPTTAGGASDAGVLVKPSAYRLWRTNANINFSISVGAAETTNTVASRLSVATTKFWCGVYDGATLQQYINGLAVGTPTAKTGNIDTNSNNLLIAAMTSGPTLTWDGRIDEPMIWTRALDADEISARYNAGVITTTRRGMMV